MSTNLFHRLAHFIGWNGGYIDHEKDANGIWWIGFRCAGCGELQHKQKSHHQDCDHRNVTVTEDGGRCEDCKRDLNYNTETRNWK